MEFMKVLNNLQLKSLVATSWSYSTENSLQKTLVTSAVTTMELLLLKFKEDS